MLRCSDNSIYTGYTDDLDKRMKKHAFGLASKYTRSRLPVELVYYEEMNSKSEAMSREARIKLLNREKKLLLIETSQGKMP